MSLETAGKFAEHRHGMAGAQTRVISITSGKGGVGKTSIVSNTALQLAREGKRVLILDGDLGMANVDIMFNVRPQKTIQHVISGECEMSEILVEVAKNVTLIPGGNGIFALQNMSVFEKQALLNEVSQLGHRFDVMLIDTAPGIDDNVLYLNSAAQEICVVVTPDPASVADSYALIKVLHQRCRENRFSIICNQVKDEADGQRLFNKLDAIANRFLYVGLDYKGSIPSDLNLRQATRAQQLVTQSHPEAVSSQAIRKLAAQFVGYTTVGECKGGLQFFWQQLVGVA
ncbi:MAG TPA: MinD/ParA family protein [Bdellovibrionales bacterium]|nr:MinD/ParA family protein [Bdellovibrionales bacterium]